MPEFCHQSCRYDAHQQTSSRGEIKWKCEWAKRYCMCTYVSVSHKAFSQRLKEDVFFLARWPLCKLPMLDLVSTSLSLSCNIACSCWKPFRSFKTVALTMVSRLNLQSCNCCVNAHFKHVPLEWGLSESDWWINQVEALWKGLLGTRLKFEKLWFRCEQASWKLTC